MARPAPAAAPGSAATVGLKVIGVRHQCPGAGFATHRAPQLDWAALIGQRRDSCASRHRRYKTRYQPRDQYRPYRIVDRGPANGLD